MAHQVRSVSARSPQISIMIGPEFPPNPANSIGRCNSFREYIRRRPIAKCLAGPRVELARNRIQLGLGVAGEVGPLRQILAQQAVRVLVGPALPRTVGIAEIDLHPGGDREGAMGRQFQAAIPGQRGHEAGGQSPHVLGERPHDRARLASGHPDETHVARTPLYPPDVGAAVRGRRIVCRSTSVAT